MLTFCRATGRLLTVLSLLLPSWAAAQSSVWVASQGDNRVYLAGTVHLLRPLDYPLPVEFDSAYAQANRVFFETDIAAMSDPMVQAGMLQQLMYTDTRSLRSVLTPEAMAALESHLTGLGMPVLMVERFKPGLLVSTLQVLEFQRLGFTPQGVDMHFHGQAQRDGKPTGQLESVQAQIDFIARMGEGSESDFVLMSLNDLEEMGGVMNDLIDSWRQGDVERLERLFVDDMRTQSPDLYRTLLVDRNNAWMPIIEGMFAEPGTEFVLVGAAHLAGPNGLLALLAGRGYQIEQIRGAP